MRKVKVFISMLLVITMFGNFSLLTVAHSADDTEEQNVIPVSGNVMAGNQTREFGNCATCFAATYLVCMDDSTFVATREHLCLKGTCTFTVYESTKYRYCVFCERVLNTYPPHLCWESHNLCFKGSVYDFCIGDYKHGFGFWD